MKDRIPANPGRVLITPENGGAPYYATVTRSDNPTQAGDPLSKNTLLKDSTAALFSLSPDALPDDVLKLLGNLQLPAFRNAVANEYVWRRSDGQIDSYVNAPDADAYPPAVDDGFIYEALGKLGEKTRIATGSYVGTGTYGEENPNTLTFDFEPKVVFIFGYARTTNNGGENSRLTALVNPYGSYAHAFDEMHTGVVSWNDKTVSWYSINTGSSQYEKYTSWQQLNKTNATYYYIAIG